MKGMKDEGKGRVREGRKEGKKGGGKEGWRKGMNEGSRDRRVLAAGRRLPVHLIVCPFIPSTSH